MSGTLLVGSAAGMATLQKNTLVHLSSPLTATRRRLDHIGPDRPVMTFVLDIML